MENHNAIKGHHNNILNLVIDSLVKHKRRHKKKHQDPEQIPPEQEQTLDEVAQSLPPAPYVPTNVITVNPAGAPTPTMFDVFKQQQLHAYENMQDMLRNELHDLKMNAEPQIQSWINTGHTQHAQSLSDSISQLESLVNNDTQTSPPPSVYDEYAQTSPIPTTVNDTQTSPIPVPTAPKMVDSQNSPINEYGRMFINTGVVSKEEAKEIKVMVKEYLQKKRAPVDEASTSQSQEEPSADPKLLNKEELDEMLKSFSKIKLNKNDEPLPKKETNPLARMKKDEKKPEYKLTHTPETKPVDEEERLPRTRSVLSKIFEMFKAPASSQEEQEMQDMPSTSSVEPSRLNFDNIPVFTKDEKGWLTYYKAKLAQPQGANNLNAHEKQNLAQYTQTMIKRLLDYLPENEKEQLRRELLPKKTYMEHFKILEKYMK